MKVKTQDIFEMKIKELDLHPLALTTPRMTDINYTALLTDIELNGQLEPVTLFRGRIIDGRHRWLILQELGIEEINAVKLAPSTTIAELKAIVKSKETRRHETPTQLAITAYRMMVDSETKIAASKAADIVGADRRKVSDAKNIAVKYERLDILTNLFNGEKIDIGTSYIPRPTDSLPAILDWLAVNSVKKANTDIRGQVQMTEEQFAECAVKIVELKCLDIRLVKHITSKMYTYIKDHEIAILEANKLTEEAEKLVNVIRKDQ